MPQGRSKRKMAPNKWLVRAPNGDLYVLTQGNVPIRIKKNSQEYKRVRGIIRAAESKVAKVISRDIPSVTSGINLAITEAFSHE